MNMVESWLVESWPRPSKKYNLLNWIFSTRVASLWSQRNNRCEGIFFGLYIVAMRCTVAICLIPLTSFFLQLSVLIAFIGLRTDPLFHKKKG